MINPTGQVLQAEAAARLFLVAFSPFTRGGSPPRVFWSRFLEHPAISHLSECSYWFSLIETVGASLKEVISVPKKPSLLISITEPRNCMEMWPWPSRVHVSFPRGTESRSTWGMREEGSTSHLFA